MRHVLLVITIVGLALSGPQAAFAGKTSTVDPALMQPPLNPTFAPWDCWRAGDRIICEGAMTETYAGLEVDFLACDAGPAYSAGTVTSVARRVGDVDGRALITTFRDSYVEWFTADPGGSGPRLRSAGNVRHIFEYAVAGDPSTVSVSTIGVEIRVTGQGVGLLMHDVGVRTWDSDGNLLKAAGSHISFESFMESHSRICSALGLED